MIRLVAVIGARSNLASRPSTDVTMVTSDSGPGARTRLKQDLWKFLNQHQWLSRPFTDSRLWTDWLHDVIFTKSFTVVRFAQWDGAEHFIMINVDVYFEEEVGGEEE